MLLAKATSGLKHFIFFKIKESCKVVYSFPSFTAPWPSRSSLPPLSLTSSAVCVLSGAAALGSLTPPSRDSSQLTCLPCLEPHDCIRLIYLLITLQQSEAQDCKNQAAHTARRQSCVYFLTSLHLGQVLVLVTLLDNFILDFKISWVCSAKLLLNMR